MKSGDAFVLRSHSIDGRHPRIVISDPNDGRVVVVNVTEWAENKDQSCVLEAGCDTIITKKSVVSYRDATIVETSDLAKFTDSGDIIVRPPVSKETVERILSGCGVTRRINQGPYDFLDQLGLIPVN